MKYPARHVLKAAVALGIIVAAIADARAQDQQEKLIRVSAARSASAAGLWGFNPFGKKYGLRTEVTAAATNADMQRALQSGGVEVATLGYQSAAVLAEQKISNVKIIAGASVGGQNLIMRKGVELRSWKELEGKRIGRPPGTYVMILFALAAQEFGVDLAKVNLINTTPAGVTELQALKNGDLDGWLHWSPVIDRAVAEGYAYYPSCCDIGSTSTYGAGNQIVAANTEFLKDRTTALNFPNAYLEALEYYNKNTDKAAELIAQYTSANVNVLQDAIKRSRWDPRVNVQTAVNLAKHGPTFGFTKADMSADVPNFFDLNLLAEASGRPVAELSRLR
ncbi:MAG: ABC transporter substrate-binding protein [Deltaproteobacteria bacterium]|nr:ABC transporter substrate-binding protein [Deltaproteobacteria bacterium]